MADIYHLLSLSWVVSKGLVALSHAAKYFARP